MPVVNAMARMVRFGAVSRTAADRDFTGMKNGGPVAKGTPITGDMCHSNELLQLLCGGDWF